MIRGYSFWWLGNGEYALIGNWPHFNPKVGWDQTAQRITKEEGIRYWLGDESLINDIATRMIESLKRDPTTGYLWNE